MNQHLTPAMARALNLMLQAEKADRWEDAEILQEGLSCWIGEERIHAGTVKRLMRLCLVSQEDCINARPPYRFTLNGDGRRIVTDENYTPLILVALKEGRLS